MLVRRENTLQVFPQKAGKLNEEKGKPRQKVLVAIICFLRKNNKKIPPPPRCAQHRSPHTTQAYREGGETHTQNLYSFPFSPRKRKEKLIIIIKGIRKWKIIHKKRKKKSLDYRLSKYMALKVDSVDGSQVFPPFFFSLHFFVPKLFQRII